MGASGIMEAIATILSIKTGLVPPTLFTEGNEEGLTMDLVRGAARQADIRYALSQSFGFGGACACVVFRRYSGEESDNA